MDVAAACIWYVISLMVIWYAWRVARRAFPGDGASQCVMHAVTLIWAWIALVSFGLGAFGGLNAASLGTGVALLALGTWFCFRRRFPDGSPLVAPLSSQKGWHARVWNVLWSAMAALGTVLLIDRTLLQFPDNWDTLMYHRPLIDHWLQAGSLYVPTCPVWYVPGNNELLGLWWAAPFSGDFWVGLMSVPGVLLLVLGTYELGRVIGLTPLLRHATAITVLSSSVVFQQMTTAKNDIAVAGLLVTGLAYGFRYLSSVLQEEAGTESRNRPSDTPCIGSPAPFPNRCDLALAAAALGLLAGIKYYALGYAGVAWLGLSVMAWSRWGRRTALFVSLAMGGVMLLTAGYWYGRNFAVRGTPLYPLGYFGKQTEEAQMHRSAWQSSFLGNGRLEVWPQYLEAVGHEAGVAQTLAVLVMPTSLAWLCASVLTLSKHRDRPDMAILRWGFAIVLIGAWFNFAITPFTVSPENSRLIKNSFIVCRFSLVPQALSVVAFSLLLSDVSGMIKSFCGRRLVGAAFSALLPLSFTAVAVGAFLRRAQTESSVECLLVLLLAFDVVLLGVMWRKLPGAVATRATRIRRVFIVGVLGIGMAAFALSSSSLSGWWHGNFAAHYDERFRTRTFSILENSAGSVRSVTAIFYRYYPFFGSRRQFRAQRPKRMASKEFLFRYLVNNKADAAALISGNASRNDDFKSYHRAAQWIDESTDSFEKIDSGNTFDLYRIDRETLEDCLKGKNHESHE